VAKELDVSAMTVSRSLRHDRTIHPETRARVNEVARRMGYKARTRRPRRNVEQDVATRTLGLLLRHQSLDSAHHDNNLMKMMAGIMAVTDEQGMHMKVHTWHSPNQTGTSESTPELPPHIQDITCQALIAHGDHKEQNLQALAHRVPMVSMGRIYRNLPIDAAVADNIEGIHRLVTHLAELGHRHLAWVGAYYKSTFMEARKAGMIQGCIAHNLEVDREHLFGPEIYQGHRILNGNALLAAADAGATAFICGNDAIALEVIAILEAGGKRVPADISVTGYDAWIHPSKTRLVTTINPNFYEIGKSAARLALQRIAHPTEPPYMTSVRGDLEVGDTTGAVPQ
jgi:DNA-binding LacI/PurR family transcriptional regulator